MYITPPQIAIPLPALPNKPTDSQRHELLHDSLARVERTEDYKNIISLLSPPADITQHGNPGEFKNVKVGIIGGGLAGMSAAFELRKLGYDITIFEATADRIGGRIYTYYFDKDKRLYGELGAMRIPVSHETVWHYINLFRLNTETFFGSNSNTYTFVRDIRALNDPGNQNIFYQIYPRFELTTQEKNTPWPTLYSNVNKYYLSTMPPEIRKQLLMILPKYDYRHDLIANISIREAMQQYGLSDEAVNLIGGIMSMIGGILFHSYEIVLNEEYSLDFLDLYQISGGMVNLPLAFYNSLTSQYPKEYPDIPQNALGKVTWKGGFFVDGIYRSDTIGKTALSYRTLTDSRQMFDTFDYVICAAPMSQLREMAIQPLFSGRKMQAIREVLYEDSQKTLFLCRERFWEKQGIRGGSSYTDTVIGLVDYPSDHAHCTQNTVNCSPDEPGVLMASYDINQDSVRLGNLIPAVRNQIITRIVERLHGLPGGYLNSIIMDSKTVDWYREPWFYGAFQMFMPGQKRDFLYVSTTPEYDNRVFFSGEHTSTKNAWIQGALQSGMSAANDVAYYSVIHKYQK